MNVWQARAWATFAWVHRTSAGCLASVLHVVDRVAGKLPPPGQLLLPLLLGAGSCAIVGWHGEAVLIWLGTLSPDQTMLLARSGFGREAKAIELLCRCTTGLLLAACVLAWVRKAWTVVLLKAVAAVFVCVWCLVLYQWFSGPALLNQASPISFHKYMRNEAFMAALLVWFPSACGAGLLCLLIVRRSTLAWYGTVADCETPTLGDRWLAIFRTGGKDSRFSSSVWWAWTLHLCILVLIPILMRGCGWEAPYAIPKGEGEQVVAAKMQRVKKKVERKRMILSMNTDILFYRPDPNESDVLNDTELVTQHQYEARGVEGKTGTTGGKAGGWPEGMPGKVRFIRLEYAGGDWDQDLQLGADDNMLIKLGEMTGLPVARNAEHRAIGRLKFFPEGKAPPFVFLTGRSSVTLTNHEAETLREYCLGEGGMIFADNGGGTFNSGFRAAMKRVFPDKSWITVSKDDPIFQYPYLFSDGAPALWHHSGREVVGLRHNGRWVVFYHQGDLNDAWKTGHSGIHEGLANQAYKVGVNVIHYAFTQYLAQHQE